LSETSIIFLVLIAGFAIGLGPVLWGQLRRGRVLKKGYSAPARIINVKDTGRRHNRNPVVKINVVVTDAAGREFPGQVKMPVSVVRLPGLQPGQTIRVKYLPGSPASIAIDDNFEFTDSQ